MNNKRSVKQDKHQNNGGKKRIMRRRRGKGKKNKNKFDESADATTSNNNSKQHQNNKSYFQKMNRQLKRLNNNKHFYKNSKNKQNFKEKVKNMNKGNTSFLNALSDYKRMRNLSKQDVNPSTSKDNQENLRAYESVTVISDDDLEDGEIIEDKVTQYVSLIAESFSEIERSKKIKDNKSPDSSHENQPTFYVDKSADSISEVPLYKSLSDSPESMSVDDSVILINDTHSNSDESVIIIEDKTPIKTQFTTGSDFISLSPISHETSNQQELTSKEKRKERQKARIKTWKQKKMVEKVLELQSNGLLEGIPPIKVPIRLVSPNEASTSSLVQIVPKPTQKTSVPVPSTSQNIPTLSQVVKGINPVQTVSFNPQSLHNVQLNSAVNLQTDREKRRILIDGSNIAMGFTASEVGKKGMSNDYKEFSAEALKQVIEYFEKKGFQVKAVVPEFRVRRQKSSNHTLMVELLEGNKLITTPSKSYDDLILLESAAKLDAAIVSNDLFRDIKNTKKHQQDVMDVINKRQIRYNWVFGEFILADDPYGRAGPKLDDILYK